MQLGSVLHTRVHREVYKGKLVGSEAGLAGSASPDSGRALQRTELQGFTPCGWVYRFTPALVFRDALTWTARSALRAWLGVKVKLMVLAFPLPASSPAQDPCPATP